MSNFDNYGKGHPGWHTILHPILLYADKHGFQVVQVKEKFGGLRVYYDQPEAGVDKEVAGEMRRMVSAAETLSMHICEDCGLPGECANHGGGYWVLTLCPICSKKHVDQKRIDLAAREAKA